jgi:hypothetical protein
MEWLTSFAGLPYRSLGGTRRRANDPAQFLVFGENRDDLFPFSATVFNRIRSQTLVSFSSF